MTRGRERNSCADANVSGCQPPQRISASNDSRTEMSSSTMNTIGEACDMSSDLDSWSSALAKLMYIPLYSQGARAWRIAQLTRSAALSAPVRAVSLNGLHSHP